MNTIKRTAIAVFTLIIMGACSKENVNPPVTNTDSTATYLMAGTWKLTGIKVVPGVNGNTDLSSILPECEKDNIFQFKAGNKFIFDQGAMKCDASLAQSDEGSWSYDPATKKLNYSSPVLHQYSLTITTSSAKTIVGYYMGENGGVPNTITGTFTLQ